MGVGERWCLGGSWCYWSLYWWLSCVRLCVCVCLFDWGITAQIYCHFSVFRSMECDKLHATSQRLWHSTSRPNLILTCMSQWNRSEKNDLEIFSRLLKLWHTCSSKQLNWGLPSTVGLLDVKQQIFPLKWKYTVCLHLREVSFECVKIVKTSL